MTPDDLFAMAGQVAVLGWAALILGPRRFPWFNRIPALILPAVLSLLYALVALSRFAGADGGFGSLAEVRTLFTDDWALLAGWVHYLAFDLMIGAMVAARMDRVGVIRLLQAPILVLVFLLGPLGALLALFTEAAMRAGDLRRVSRSAPAPALVPAA
jgi:hypothetical protein